MGLLLLIPLLQVVGLDVQQSRQNQRRQLPPRFFHFDEYPAAYSGVCRRQFDLFRNRARRTSCRIYNTSSLAGIAGHSTTQREALLWELVISWRGKAASPENDDVFMVSIGYINGVPIPISIYFSIFLDLNDILGAINLPLSLTYYIFESDFFMGIVHEYAAHKSDIFVEIR